MGYATPSAYALAVRLRAEMSAEERMLWEHLRRRRTSTGLKWRRKHPIFHFVVDFYCHAARLAVDIDVDTVAPDASRKLHFLGVVTLHFSTQELRDDLDGVLEKIRTVALSRLPPVESTATSASPVATPNARATLEG